MIFVILFVVVFIAVAILAIRPVMNALNPPVPTPSYVEVYIAKQPIPQGSVITEDVLTTMKLPPENVIGVMFELNEKGVLLNKVAKIAIDQGLPITEAMVLDSTSSVPITGPKWAITIPPGMTAVTMPANRFSLSANGVAAGSHVNLTGCFKFVDVDPAFQSILPNKTANLTSTGFLPDTLTALTLQVAEGGGNQGRVELDPSLQQPYYLVPSEAQRPRMVCQMLLQDTVVMTVGDFYDPATVPTPAPNQPPPPAPAQDTVTLIVTPQDSITLTYLMYADAQITMTLRNPTDQARQATEAATLQFLLSQYNIPVPAKLPYSMDTMTNTNGDSGFYVTDPPLPNK
jgi:pilus assembly protein CpaB